MTRGLWVWAVLALLMAPQACRKGSSEDISSNINYQPGVVNPGLSVSSGALIVQDSGETYAQARTEDDLRNIVEELKDQGFVVKKAFLAKRQNAMTCFAESCKTGKLYAIVLEASAEEVAEMAPQWQLVKESEITALSESIVSNNN